MRRRVADYKKAGELGDSSRAERKSTIIDVAMPKDAVAQYLIKVPISRRGHAVPPVTILIQESQVSSLTPPAPTADPEVLFAEVRPNKSFHPPRPESHIRKIGNYQLPISQTATSRPPGLDSPRGSATNACANFRGCVAGICYVSQR